MGACETAHGVASQFFREPAAHHRSRQFPAISRHAVSRVCADHISPRLICIQFAANHFDEVKHLVFVR
jgi:hypothetical protein